MNEQFDTNDVIDFLKERLGQQELNGAILKAKYKTIMTRNAELEARLQDLQGELENERDFNRQTREELLAAQEQLKTLQSEEDDGQV